MRFKLVQSGLPDFSISIKDGRPIEFIECSGNAAIRELEKHSFDGIPKELVDFISNNIDKYIFNSLDIDPYRIEIFNSLYGSLYVRSQDVRGTRGKSPF